MSIHQHHYVIHWREGRKEGEREGRREKERDLYYNNNLWI